MIRQVGRTEIVITKPGPVRTSTRTVQVPAKIPSCRDFSWQQDAQAAYVANLSDPGALDGAKGPHNGDGIACNQLPADPNRARSIPIDPYLPPGVSAPARAALVSPATRYFGLAEDGLPGDASKLAGLARQIGKAPNLIEYFQDLDSPGRDGQTPGFRPDLVQAAWRAGALPVITLQTQGRLPGRDYSLRSVVDGAWDSYFARYAGEIMQADLPVVLRLDHEMNGSWYPWSGGLPQNQGEAGQPNLYVQAWRHIWQLFEDIGANQQVIWAWTPARVDGLSTQDSGRACGSAGCQHHTTLAENYPGDGYVDWVGCSGYAWNASRGSTASWTPEATYGATLAALQRLTSKPIFIAEAGAARAYGGAPARPGQPAVPGLDTSAAQTRWINAVLPYVAAHPGIVGFTYFNNHSTGAHVVDGIRVVTDWRLDDSPGALAAFRAGIADPRFGSGIMPDGS